MLAPVAGRGFSVWVLLLKVPADYSATDEKVTSLDQKGDCPDEVEDVQANKALDEAGEFILGEGQLLGLFDGLTHRVEPQQLEAPYGDVDGNHCEEHQGKQQ